MKKNVLTLLMVSLSLAIFSQEPDLPSSYSTQLLPNNPDAASLEKFGNVPVNTYNGTANVSVPIYNLNFEGLSIPITARYNTSGVRVTQEASLIGLGWNLNEGYTITREIQGFDDLNSQLNGIKNQGWIYTDTYLEYNFQPYNRILIHPDKFQYLAFKYAENRPPDTEPDLFTINLPNGSVSFYLPKIQEGDTELIGKVINEKNYKVFYNIADKTFRVIDLLGFEYTFDVIERSSWFTNWPNYTSFTPKPPATNEVDAMMDIPNWYNIMQTSGIILNWKLSKITSPLNKELSFDYEDGLYCSYPHFSEKSIHSTGQGNVASPLVNASISLFYTKYLSNITGDFGKITFEKSNRLDLSSMESFSTLRGHPWRPENNRNTNIKKLDAVVVKDYHGNTVHRADFSYSYFNANQQTHTHKEKYLRLKLDEITVNGQKYAFDYLAPNGLAPKDSKSVDFWGFYNGESNTLRVPSSNRYYWGFVNNRPPHYRGTVFSKSLGANRKSNIDFGKKGLLYKVTYPTGGSTEFVYQGNSVTLKKPYHIRKMNANGSIASITGLGSSKAYNFRYQYLKLANDPSYSLYNSTYTPETCEVIPNNAGTGTIFETSDTQFCNGQSYNTKIDITLRCVTSCANAGSPSGRAVWLENIDTGDIQDLASFDNHNLTLNTPIVISVNRSLTPNRYRLHTGSWYQNGKVVTATATATYYQDNGSVNEIPNIYEEFEVGGARVQKVITKDHNGSILKTNVYAYNGAQPNGAISSSGKLMDDLVYTSAGMGNYEYTPEVFEKATTAYQSYMGAYLHSENQIRTKNSASGSHVGYSQVAQWQEDTSGTTLGKAVSSFINKENEYLSRSAQSSAQLVGTTGNNAPFINNAAYYQMIYNGTWRDYFTGDLLSVPETYILGGVVKSYDYQNGAAIKSQVFNKAGDLVQETQNQYTTLIMNTAFGFYPKILFFGRASSIFHPFETVYASEHIGNNKLYKLKKSTRKEYLNGQEFVSATEYTYPNRKHTFVTEVQTTDSKGEKRTQKTYYPQDTDNTNLVLDNRLAIPIKAESYKEATKLSGQNVVYSYFGSHYLPRLSKSFKGDTEKEGVVFHQYDTSGNPLEVSQKDGTRIVYIWGYKKSQPIAKIENTTYSQVQSYVSNLQSLSDADNDRCLDSGNCKEKNLRTKLNELRSKSALSGAQITTYTYDPLVGITSTTDPRGNTVYYEYDSYNRLLHVKDNEGHILSKNQYHYKN